RHGKQPDDDFLVRAATACEDARNYIVLGDPAVRLPVVAPPAPDAARPAANAGSPAAPALAWKSSQGPAREPAPPVRERPIRLLAAVASPSALGAYGLAEIAAKAELLTLAKALAEAIRLGQVELRPLEAPVSLERLSDELRRWCPHVLYLVAHGKLDPE